MIALGQFNTLPVLRLTPDYVWLDGGETGEIRLPRAGLSPLPQAGETVRAFVYTGEDGYPAASVRTPLALVNEVASLTTLEAGRQGVWLDLEVEEAVFMPRAEQQQRLEPGWRSVVMILEDERLGLIASARLNDFLEDEAEGLAAGEKVSLVVALRTDLGFKAVVNNRYWGMLYADEVFEPLRIGDRREGYIKRLRDDRRLDVSLAPPGYAKVEGASELVLRRLEQAGGFLPLGDHSSPEAIHAEFGISKKVFKQAIGALFRQQWLVIENDGISLVRERR
ncbi:MAG TPA: S1-like domain-containing RNA-binding protein [Fluviicoccus sp.]|nr:S1-like domain-containing RNA-binding protein [Fluviicoccus sp.]